MSRLTMMTTLENATQKSITRPTRSVHHASFLWALCHAPRYCMGSRNGGLCPRPGVVRRGRGYYCEEHAAYPAEYPRRRP
jgi:hypothetical protein